MADEPNTPPAAPVDTPAPEPEEKFTLTDASFKPEPAVDDPVPPPKADEDDDDIDLSLGGGGRRLPGGIVDRVKRANRQRDEAKAKADEFETKLKEVTTLAEKALAKAGLKEPDAAKFDSYEDYTKAKRVYDATMAEKLELPKPPAPPSEADEALADVREAVEAADPALWKQAVDMANATQAKGEALFFTDLMMVEVADADDPVGLFKAVIGMPEDERKELAGLGRRALRRELREMAKAAPVTPPAPAAPAKDPETGRFVKRQSEAPPPVEPVRAPAAGPRAVTDPTVPLSEFFKRRDAEEKTIGTGW